MINRDSKSLRSKKFDILCCLVRRFLKRILSHPLSKESLRKHTHVHARVRKLCRTNCRPCLLQCHLFNMYHPLWLPLMTSSVEWNLTFKGGTFKCCILYLFILTMILKKSYCISSAILCGTPDPKRRRIPSNSLLLLFRRNRMWDGPTVGYFVNDTPVCMMENVYLYLNFKAIIGAAIKGEANLQSSKGATRNAIYDGRLRSRKSSMIYVF